MSDDLVQRLRSAAARKWPDPNVAAYSMFSEAADRIEAHAAEIARLAQSEAHWIATAADANEVLGARIDADAALLRHARTVLRYYALEQRHLHKPGLTETLAALDARLGETT